MIKIRNQYIVAAVLLLALVVVFGCSDDSPNPTVSGGESRAPVGIPTADDNVSLSPTLYWHPVGDWGDSVSYDLYFGTSSTPSATFANLSDTSQAPGPLVPDTQYRWAVRAKINGTATAWSTVNAFSSRTSITYPVAVGNRWEYRWHHRWVGTNLGDRAGYYVVEIDRVETGWLAESVLAFEETWYNFADDALAHATSYYYVDDDGLKLAAYINSGGINPVSGDESCRFQYNDRQYSSLGDWLARSDRNQLSALSLDADTIVEDPAKLVLEYPLAVGAAWTFRIDDPWRIEKSVTGYETVDVPAGEFGCFVVRSLVDVDDDGDFTESPLLRDYIAEEGLVLRSEMWLDVMLVDTAGHPTGVLVDMIEEYELVAWE